MSENYLYDNDFCDWYNSQTCDYKPDQLAFAWQVWQASRAALVVNLPSRVLVELSSIDDHTGIHDMDVYYGPDDVHRALREAGIHYE